MNFYQIKNIKKKKILIIKKIKINSEFKISSKIEKSIDIYGKLFRVGLIFI